MLRHVLGEPRIFPEHLTIVAFDACTLIEISKMADPVAFIDELLRHYALIIPPTALSEFNPGDSDRLDRFFHALSSFEGDPLPARELQAINSKLEYLANCYCPPNTKTKQRRRYKNQHRNDFQILQQAFSYRAALISNDTDYDRLSNFLHAPGAMIDGIDIHENLTARVPRFTLEQLVDSYSKHIVFEPRNVRFFKRTEMGKIGVLEDVVVVQIPPPEEMRHSINVRSRRDRWEVAKQIVDNPGITIIDFQDNGQWFVKLVPILRGTT